MNRRHIAVLLIFIGLLCIPAPEYLSQAAAAGSPPQQTSEVYVADSFNLSDESELDQFVDRHHSDVALADTRFEQDYHRDAYRSPSATREVLLSAMENGSATTSDDRVREDLRDIDNQYEFVHDSASQTEYYRLTVENNGSSIRAESVSLETVGNSIAEQTPHYENLSTGEQRTIDDVLDNSTGDDRGHQPRVDDPYVDQLPTTIWKGNTLYSIQIDAHVDNFAPGFGGFILGLGVAAFGILLLITGGGLYIYDRWFE